MVSKSATLVLFALLFAAEAHGATPETRAALDDAVVRSDAGRIDDGMPYLQCVPYARQVSGIQIYGDAWTWWDQAEGRYAKGTRPKVGAVMSFRPYGNMRLGHVAAVSRVIDSRTVLLRHANWSPIDGRRGQIEDNVRAIDVSPNNDWSEVRVWYAPLGALGTTHWPLNGFIYPEKVKPGTRTPTVLASATPARAAPPRVPAATPTASRPTSAPAPARAATAVVPARAATAPARTTPAVTPGRSRIGADFLAGVRPEVPVRNTVAASAPAARPLASPPSRTPAPVTAAKKPAARPTAPATARGDDPIGRIIAARSR